LTFRLRTPARLATLDRSFFTQRIRELGPMRTGEWWMLAVFLTTATLWLTRTGFDAGEAFRLPGWNVLGDRWLASLGVESPREWINDSTIAMGMALVMFIIPLRPERGGPMVRLMDWHTASRLPWGILLLFGGGFAIAEACRTTGLAEWTGVWLAAAAQGLPTWAIIVVICLLVTFLSEFTSNVATDNALLPIIAGLAVALGLDPRLLMLPATLAASCAFMLPISTPPNAIVFGSGRIRISEMAVYGLILDILGVGLIVVATYGLLVPQLQIETQKVPAWATAAE
jgi:solute carrier family 13 (sodium-dependent dicarboxylate transporter), member 2/3/5